ncbi:hypothetical protein F5X96DRAFT_338671 [Biscogniauxia mediterranea]|nr:hypothetical protein F5X96DRAFT_338671 [Biscogniauxia mediterranea]
MQPFLPHIIPLAAVVMGIINSAAVAQGTTVPAELHKRDCSVTIGFFHNGDCTGDFVNNGELTESGGCFNLAQDHVYGAVLATHDQNINLSVFEGRDCSGNSITNQYSANGDYTCQALADDFTGQFYLVNGVASVRIGCV